MSTRQAVVVVDLGFGDAGKGIVTNALVRKLGAHTVVRFNGGAQAGHNVVLGDGRHHTFSQFGAGTFVPGVETVLSRFVAIHPTALLVEADHLSRVGVSDPLARVCIDARARVTTPFHQAANRLREIARGDARHGSCGIGFGETIADAEAGNALLARDLGDRSRLRGLLVAMQERKRSELGELLSGLGGSPAVDSERRILESRDVVDAWMDRIAAVVGRARVVDEAEIASIMARDGAVVFEGAQGVLLDEWFGFHPHTTWSTCTFANALTILKEASFDGTTTRLGVTRTFAIRHGAGPMPTHDVVFDDLPEPHNVLGPWQGGVRRGWADFVLLRYALAVCGGVDALALTHLDALARLPQYRVATHYEVHGQTLAALARAPSPDLDHQVRLTRLLETARPLFAALVANPATCIARFAAEARAPIALTSCGPTAGHVSFGPGLLWE